MPRKANLKKKETVEVIDAPSEAATEPVQFVTIQELMQQSGMAFALSEDVESPGLEPEVDESPTWTVKIDGLQEMEAGGTKFSVFTPGEASSGQMVIEFLTKSGVNKGLFAWMTKPSERQVQMSVSDHDGNAIETWRMKGVPVALAVDELDRESKDPWYTTLQLAVREIQIT